MVDYSLPLYRHPQETWNVKTCEKLAKRWAMDGCGTKYPFQGYLYQGELGHYALGMTIRWNGGLVIDGKWWQGEEWQLPQVPEGFEIIYMPTWGYRLRRLNEEA